MSRKKRRFLQFRIRAALILTALAAVLLGGWKVLVGPYMAQHRDMKTLRETGASIKSEYTLSGYLSWIARLDPIGSDRYHEAISVSMRHNPFKREFLRQLKSLRKLEELEVSGADFHTNDLERLLKTKPIKRVLLDSTSVTWEDAIRIRDQYGIKVQLSQKRDTRRFPFPNYPQSQYYRRQVNRMATTSKELIEELSLSLAVPEESYALTLVPTLLRENNPSPRLRYFYFLFDLTLEQPGWPMADVATMPNLRNLTLRNMQLDDVDLSALAKCKTLRGLDLSSTNLTDAKLAELAKVTQLETLWLKRTTITGKGLRHLSQHVKLRELRLAFNKNLDDGALRPLQGMTELRVLDARETNIGDASMRYLSGMTKMYELKLRRTQVTDAGLEHLRGMDNLRWLDLSSTRVSKKSADAFEEGRLWSPIVR